MSTYSDSEKEDITLKSTSEPNTDF